jgi:hypothetical protein
MRYYAYLKQLGEGCDYSIGCAQTLIKFEANNDEEAKKKLEEIIKENYRGETELESLLLFKNPIPFDLGSVYSKIWEEETSRKSKMQHLKDMEDYEKLKKKLGL